MQEEEEGEPPCEHKRSREVYQKNVSEVESEGSTMTEGATWGGGGARKQEVL